MKDRFYLYWGLLVIIYGLAWILFLKSGLFRIVIWG